jgi:uncharacterized phage-like protein YoqJ
MDQIRAALKKHRPLYGISGMALGADQDFIACCLDLKIPYVAAVPFVGQERVWRPAAQAVYRDLLSKAREVVVVSEGGYASYKMQVRNQWLIDHSNLLLAVFDGSPGGTANTVEYARRVGRTIEYIDPCQYR